MPGHETPQLAPAGATPARRHPRFPSRNRRFPDRCRSPDCASTAFRCRCPLLRQKLFVLPRRTLRNNYTPCPTGIPTFAAARRQRRDLIIATRPAHQPLPSLHQRQRRRDNFAPRRELLLSAVTKVAKSTGRNYVSALPQRATVGCDFPHLLAGITFHHRCQSKGLRVRSPARRLTRPLASATAGVFRSYRHPPKPSPRVAHPPSLPSGGPRC